MTTDADLVGLLRQIKEIALSPYPFPEGARRDFGLTIALGQVAGVAMKAVADYERRQKEAAE